MIKQNLNTIIDFDDPSTFPEELSLWDTQFENKIRDTVITDNVTEGWQIERQLQDLYIDEEPLVTDYLDTHLDTEVAVSHVTRILDIEKFKREGLITGGGYGSIADKRLRNLLSSIGLDKPEEDKVMAKVYEYWKRDGKQRTENVHFQFDRKNIYNDDRLNEYAINLGGEILRWAIYGCGENLFQTEPYKRLWIWGKPCIVKFKCSLADMCPSTRAPLLAEIVKYYIVTRVYGYSYEFAFAGKTIGSVPGDNIISIEEIEGFIEMQEKYDEFAGFYDEIKQHTEGSSTDSMLSTDTADEGRL